MPESKIKPVESLKKSRNTLGPQHLEKLDLVGDVKLKLIGPELGNSFSLGKRTHLEQTQLDE